jgi:transcriptional regulator with XRE-family HTH domain
MSSLTANGLQNAGLPYKLTGGGNGLQFREALGEVIRERRLADGLQLRELASSAHISYSFLSEVERGLKEASSGVIDGIANGLRLEPYELILEAGYRMATGSVIDARHLEWQNQYQDLVVR